MSNLGLFNKHLTLLGKTLDLRSKKNDLLASNIANRETPGYRAKDISFERSLYKALHSDRPGPLKTTDPRHFDGIEREPLQAVNGQLFNSFSPRPREDGNTVNLDKEMAKLAENQVVYSTLVQITNWKFNMLKSAIQEGGR